MPEDQNTPNQPLDESADNNKGFESKDGKNADDYYSVDHPKRDTTSTIGDGTMHNEGLVGEGDTSEDDLFSKGITGEKAEEEWHDSEG